ncbi:phospholipase D [Chondromyces crocatus]|uniref:Phospholipase D n=2 Tax=Chondromyces crocatus TaxID=52 RepID=A0A0K1EP19_CHOCO|nr:phospholipase D [Chondromyces crocatus]
MIQGATTTLDIAQFYISDAPGSRLGPILGDVEAAAARGVQVRILVDEIFYRRYPDAADHLATRPGVTVRRFDGQKNMGGVLHAKYMLVDGRETYLGSQNFDWRALEHIYELGLRVRLPSVTATFEQVFALDWALAGGDATAALQAGAGAETTPAGVIEMKQEGERLRLLPVASPRGFLPGEVSWDLPRMRAMLDASRTSVELQLLSYRAAMRDGSPFPDLDESLRRAAERGVRVRLLVADWSKREDTSRALKALADVPGIEVKFISIPRWSGGFIPFARVAHAKYLVVDGREAWVGTSNWEGDYFTKSRNVGLILEGGVIPRQLGGIFRQLWDGPYVERVNPRATYVAPDIERESPVPPPL